MGPKLTQAEGFILGDGAKLFAIAGPVIVYGASVSGLNNHIILKVGRGLAPAAKQRACPVWSSLFAKMGRWHAVAGFKFPVEMARCYIATMCGNICDRKNGRVKQGKTIF